MDTLQSQIRPPDLQQWIGREATDKELGRVRKNSSRAHRHALITCNASPNTGTEPASIYLDHRFRVQSFLPVKAASRKENNRQPLMVPEKVETKSRARTHLLEKPASQTDDAENSAYA